MTSTDAIIYLRLSDLREGSDFAAREVKLRAEAARLGWTVARVVIENDAIAEAKGLKDGRRRGASAFKRVPVMDKRTGKPKRDEVTGRIVKRVFRPGWQSVIADLATGRAGAVLAEDLDRTGRDPRDLEDLLDACAESGASARSVSGSLTLTDGGTGGEIDMARVMVTMGNKSSRDTARRVSAGRERTAEAGRYAGGVRPFGYQRDPDAPAGSKTLVMVESEADEIRNAARAVLAGVSLRAIARDLRDREVPTVTRTARWSPDTLRGVLMSRAIAGLTVHTKLVKADGEPARKVSTEHAATWPAILDRETWQAVADKLTEPGRTTRPAGGNEPKWLVSGIARCGCAVRDKDGNVVRESCGEYAYTRGAGAGRPSYVCKGPQQHLRRTATGVDACVSAVMVERLSRDDGRDLMRPPARPEVDAPKLRNELKRLKERKAKNVRLNVAGDMDDDDMMTANREIKRRMEAITSQLAATTAPDPLEELRDVDDVAAAWDALSLPRKREVIKLLMRITLLPGVPGAPRRFQPDSVRIEWTA